MDAKKQADEAGATGPNHLDRDCAEQAVTQRPSAFPEEPVDNVIDPLMRFLHNYPI